MATLALVVLMSFGSAHAAPVVGDLNSDNNDLSWMISVSRSWDGSNADLNGQLTDTLPCDMKATVTFKSGTFKGGVYRGWLHKGDFVFYEVDEVVPCGEWRRLVRAGRCGNPATGRYFVPKPQLPEAPPPCAPPEPPICIPPPPPLPPPPTEVKVDCHCPTPPPVVCPPPVINNYISCPTPERPAPQQPHAGAQIVRYNWGGADVMVGWGFGGKCRTTRYCPPYPDTPIPDPPVRPAPPR